MPQSNPVAALIAALGGAARQGLKNQLDSRNRLDAAAIQGEYGLEGLRLNHAHAAEQARLKAESDAKTAETQLEKARIDAAGGVLKTREEGRQGRMTARAAVKNQGKMLENLGTREDIKELSTQNKGADFRLTRFDPPKPESEEDFNSGADSTPSPAPKPKGKKKGEFDSGRGVVEPETPMPAIPQEPAPAEPEFKPLPRPESTGPVETPKPAEVPAEGTVKPKGKPKKSSTEEPAQENTNGWELETDPEVIKSSFKPTMTRFNTPGVEYTNPHRNSNIKAIVGDDGSFVVTSAHYPNMQQGPGVQSKEEALNDISKHIADYHRGVLGEENQVSKNFLTKPKLQDRPLLGTSTLSQAEPEEDNTPDSEEESDVSHETESTPQEVKTAHNVSQQMDGHVDVPSKSEPSEEANSDFDINSVAPEHRDLAKRVVEFGKKLATDRKLPVGSSETKWPAGIASAKPPVRPAITSKFATWETNPSPNFRVHLPKGLTTFESTEQRLGSAELPNRPAPGSATKFSGDTHSNQSNVKPTKPQLAGWKKGFLISKINEFHPIPERTPGMSDAAHQKAVDTVFKNRKTWLTSAMKSNIDHMIPQEDSGA